jgi:hypothetical protein
MNPFPNWVYERYSSETLAKHAWILYSKMLLLADTETENNNISSETIRGLLQDPARLSYYISANLPLDNNTRYSLLHCENTPTRLISCIQLIQYCQDQVLQCLVCSQNLGNISDVFTVHGAEGNVGAYINPGVIVHQTITIRCLLNTVHLIHQGRPEIKDSWFPGYAWTIVCCAMCSSHLGWHFTPANRISLGFNQLGTFYGFRRAALKKADYNRMAQSGSRLSNMFARRVGNTQVDEDNNGGNSIRNSFFRHLLDEYARNHQSIINNDNNSSNEDNYLNSNNISTNNQHEGDSDDDYEDAEEYIDVIDDNENYGDDNDDDYDEFD